MTKRPSLAGLQSRLQSKGSAPAEASAAEPAPAEAVAATPPPARGARRNAAVKTAMIRINPEGWRELRRLAIDLDTPLDDLLIEAANEMLQRHGRPALVEKRNRLPV